MKGQEISDVMLEQMQGVQMVQPVALVPGGPHNAFVHTNLYVDDSGQLKNVGTNRRASDFTMQVGAPQQVHGDAFIGRICDDGNDLYHRLDFRLSELASDAPWVQEAKAYHAQGAERSQRAQALAKEVNAITPQLAAPPSTSTPMDVEAELPKELGAHEWSQDEMDITVKVLVPAGTKAKDVKVVFKPLSMSAKVTTMADGKQSVIDGSLGGKIDCDESTWSLKDATDGRELTITLVKDEGMRGQWHQFLQ